jgi:hypothetical protein
MRKITAALFSATLWVFGATSTRADVITQTNTVTGQTSNGSEFGGTFAQFNPALGTLQAVAVSFAGTGSYHVSITPIGNLCVAPTCGVTWGMSTGYSFNAPGYPRTNPNLDADMFDIVNWSGVAVSLPFNESHPLDPAMSPEDASSVAGYVGRGTVSVLGLVSEDSDFCTVTGPASCVLSDHLAMTTTLTYDYAPIPEPPAWPILLAGCVGLRVLRQRRCQVF